MFETELYGSNLYNRIAAFKVLASHENDIDIDITLKALSSNESKNRYDAIEQLSKIYTPMGLIVALTYNHVESYWEIADQLKKVLETEHSTLIVQLLTDKHYRVRAFLSEVLGLRPDLNLGEHLINLIDDDVAFVRGLAIRALSRLNYQPAVANITSRLSDEEKIYSDSDDRVCDYSAMALVKIEGKIPGEILNNLG